VPKLREKEKTVEQPTNDSTTKDHTPMTNDEFLAQSESDITPEVWASLATLRDAGFAVCAFTPTELRGAKPHRVEDQLVECGWDVIDVLATEPAPERED
jgi:hypothetical protein